MCEIETLDLINGNRMHTDDILRALGQEYELLSELGYELPTVVVSNGDETIRHITDDFILLYYFTVN